MGNSQDTQITNDLRYGKVNKFTYENSLIIQKVIDYKNAPDQLANCIHRCQLSQSINHKNIIKLHKYEVDQLSVLIYFEHYDYDLQQDINKRKLNNNYYQEHELLQMFDQFVSALAYLQQQQIFHDDIRPQNIFLTPNDTIKLNQQWVIDNTQNQQRYYAPEQIQPQPSNVQPNPFKSTSYSLGITMLHLMTLTSMEIVYLKNQVNQSLVNELLRCTNYSNKLINKIQHLLFQSPHQRADYMYQVNKQANLQQKLLSSPPKTITSSQRYVYRTSQSPLTRTIQPRHSHSPFTFRRIAQLQTPIQQVTPQQIAIIQSSPRQIVKTSSPIKVIKQQEQQQQQQQQLMFTPNQSLKTKEMLQKLDEVTPKTDLDYRIQKALKQTNETLKKNYMLQ
ncbi:unnamed protein product [Paramecium pentaurelia]|uniref:Protein kinase domain-containing protein n=1 Tax=Paramecium pentaurelia TaxID=43138 RepID=A0A8S1W2G6_9CILI|nr:unnamed protein product [Paramecium pentaurelia]